MKSAVLSLAAVLAVAAVAAAQTEVPAVPAATTAYIPGKPFTGDQLRRALDSYENVAVTLEFNNDKDRLRARLLACAHPLGYDMAGDCDELFFTFPAVNVDKAQKKAFADGQVVVDSGRWSGVHAAKPWKLKYKAVPQVTDTGFNRIRTEKIEVWLER